MTLPGRFIVLEGPDGSGKSTQAERLGIRLAETGRETLLLREPGGTRLGERIRAILLDPDLAETGVRAELFLFMACRAQLVEEVIRPALARGAVVICDRFLLSTRIYQGRVGGLPDEAIQSVAAIATGGLRPDRTVVIDVPAAIGLERVGEARDRMEARGLDFHQKVRQGYLDMAAEDDRIVVLDGTRPPDEVANAAWEAIRDVLA